MSSEQAETDDLHSRMEQCVLLPRNDPQRLALLEEMQQAPEPVRQHWLDLVEGDERLRLSMQQVEPPAGLLKRLHALPDAPPARLPTARHGRWMAVAATVAIAASAWLLVAPREAPASPFQRIGRAAISHHDHHRIDADGEGLDCQAAEATLSQSLGFTVKLPEMPEGMKLLGTSVCRIDGKPVACTRWSDGSMVCTLFQFDGPATGLPRTFDPISIEPTGQGERVRLWAEHNRVYAMVMPRLKT